MAGCSESGAGIAPLRGGRGLKHDARRDLDQLAQIAPLRGGRGLKHEDEGKIVEEALSPPYAGGAD